MVDTYVAHRCPVCGAGEHVKLVEMVSEVYRIGCLRCDVHTSATASVEKAFNKWNTGLLFVSTPKQDPPTLLLSPGGIA